MDNTSGKRTLLCDCISSVPVASDTVRIEFLWPGPMPEAGQFFLIKPEHSAVFLGRPISAAGWKKTDAAADSGILRFFMVKRGPGSRELTNMKPGEKAELIGPLGNSWAKAANLSDMLSYKPSYDNGEAGKKPLALVAGGVGIAPLLAFVREIEGRYCSESDKRPGVLSCDFYAGFRSFSFGLDDINPRSLVVASEDGSQGKRGRILDFFKPEEYSVVFACGPEPMLKLAGKMCMAAGVPCFVSMERHMACGVGACLGCRVKTVSGNRSCCSDGPVFNVRELCFDE